MLGLSSLLLQAMEQRGWSRRELASLAGISNSTLSNILTKADIMPDLRTLASLSSVLDIPMRRLVEACGIPVEGDPHDDVDRVKALVAAVPELQHFLLLLGELTPDDRESILAHTEALVHRRRGQ